MLTSLLVAGFGGQGVMVIGKLIGECAFDQGLHVTFLPSYGPEQRGGTANWHRGSIGQAHRFPGVGQPGCPLRDESALAGQIYRQPPPGWDTDDQQLSGRCRFC